MLIIIDDLYNNVYNNKHKVERCMEMKRQYII